MENWLIYYISFAVSGGLVAYIQLFRPAIHLLCNETDGDHPILRYEGISATIWIVLASFFIPALVVPILSETSRVRFIIGLTQGFLHKED